MHNSRFGEIDVRFQHVTRFQRQVTGMSRVVPLAMKRSLIGKVGEKGFTMLYTRDGSIRDGLGPDGDHWEDWRRRSLPTLHRVFSRFDGYAKYPLDDGEYAGTIGAGPEAVEETLWSEGLIRNPLAALKTDPFGKLETGSWMYRESPTSERQIHVILFRHPDEGDEQTDLYSHEEYAAGHPDPEVAVKHYNAVDYDPDAGVRWVRDNIPIDHRDRFE